jgi:hypothetical protein
MPKKQAAYQIPEYAQEHGIPLKFYNFVQAGTDGEIRCQNVGELVDALLQLPRDLPVNSMSLRGRDGGVQLSISNIRDAASRHLGIHEFEE